MWYRFMPNHVRFGNLGRLFRVGSVSSQKEDLPLNPRPRLGGGSRQHCCRLFHEGWPAAKADLPPTELISRDTPVPAFSGVTSAYAE
jgi:hypothetical protein